MSEHGKLLWELKERKGMMEARKHLVQYLHGFPNVKEYRSQLVKVENHDDIENILQNIRANNSHLLNERIGGTNPEAFNEAW